MGESSYSFSSYRAFFSEGKIKAVTRDFKAIDPWFALMLRIHNTHSLSHILFVHRKSHCVSAFPSYLVLGSDILSAKLRNFAPSGLFPTHSAAERFRQRSVAGVM
jgi:hypothetical protein